MHDEGAQQRDDSGKASFMPWYLRVSLRFTKRNTESKYALERPVGYTAIPILTREQVARDWVYVLPPEVNCLCRRRDNDGCQAGKRSTRRLERYAVRIGEVIGIDRETASGDIHTVLRVSDCVVVDLCPDFIRYEGSNGRLLVPTFRSNVQG